MIKAKFIDILSFNKAKEPGQMIKVQSETNDNGHMGANKKCFRAVHI